MPRNLLLASAAAGAILFSVGQAEAQTGPFDWAGFYAGLHGGFLNGDVRIDDGGKYTPGGNISGTIGGVIAGYNFASSPLSPNVLGIEADVGWGSIAGYGSVHDCVDDYYYDMSWDAHFRAIAGAPLGPWMPFIAGGLALTHLNVTEGCVDPAEVLVGGTLGAGLDMQLSPRVTARGEFLYDIYPMQTLGGGLSASLTAWTFRGAILFKLP